MPINLNTSEVDVFALGDTEADAIYIGANEAWKNLKLPVGLIIPYTTSGTPTGFSDFTAANGRHIFV